MLSEVFWVAFFGTATGFLIKLASMAYKSKCKEFSCCCMKIVRDVETEEKETEFLAIHRPIPEIIPPLIYNMPSIIDNPELYEKAKRIVYQEYPKHSAYRSGQLVKRYKEMGGTYSGKKDNSGLTSWFKENWKDIGGLEYPVYRPTKRVNKNTPLTPDEIDPENLLQQILLKQKYKGDKTLPAFEGKEYKIDPYAYKQAKKLGVKIEPSKKKFKKIDIYDYNNQYIMSIGDTRYNDYRSYIKERGQEYADTRRRLYKIRHERNRHKLGTPAYYADELLW